MEVNRVASITTRSEFASELTSLRESCGLTVRQVSAKVTAVGTHSTVGDWFSGRALPSTTSQHMLVSVLRVCGVDRDEDIQAWLAAWRRVRRAPGPRPNGPEPYRGLAVFQPEDAEWFFGRETLLTDLIARLATMHRRGGGLQLVVGASGSGKSSLLRAGLAAAVDRGETPLGDVGSTGITAPGEDPLSSLDPVPRDAAVVVVDQLEQLFAASAADQRAFVEALAARAAAGAVVVLAVRADFYAQVLALPQLLAATGDKQLTVGPMTEEQLRAVITAPAARAGLDLEDGLVDVLLRDIAPRRSDSAGPSGGNVLPLLAHALYQTWHRSPRGRMTIEAYRATGGVAGAVAASADAVYLSLTDQQQRLARRLFLPMAHVSADHGDTRKRARTAELLASFPAEDIEDVHLVLDEFVAQRLITTDLDHVEITHDALLYAWPTLHGWIEEDRVGLILAQQLTADAQAWRDGGRDRSSLYQGGRLASALDWHHTHAGEVSPLAAEFLAASRNHARRRTRRLYQLIAVLLALLLVAVGAADFGFSQRQSALTERDRALSRLVAGQAQRLRDFDPALAMQLSLAAYQISPTVEARSSLLDAPVGPAVTRTLAFTRAVQAVQYSPDGRLLAAGGLDGNVRLWDTSDPDPGRLSPVATLTGSRLGLFALAFSADGHTLAAAGTDGQTMLWNVTEPRNPVSIGPPLTGPASTVYALAFSPHDDLLVAGSDDGKVWRWDIRDRSRPRPLPASAAGVGSVHAVAFNRQATELAVGGAAGAWQLFSANSVTPLAAPVHAATGKVLCLAFSPDGRLLASGASDAQVRLWTLDDPQRPGLRGAPLTGPTSWINAVSFSPDGTTVAAGSSDKTVSMWSLATGAVRTRLPHPTPVTAISFRDGDSIATGSTDGAIRTWRITGPELPGTDGVFNTGFSADSRLLVTAAHDGTIRLWDVAQAHRPRPAGPPLTQPATSPTYAGTVAVNAAGTVVAVGTRSGPVQIWDVSHPQTPKAGPLLRSDSKDLIESVAFSPSGRYVAAGSDDGKVYLWDLTAANSAAPAVMPGTGGQILAVAFSPDGHRIAAAETTGAALLWDISQPDHPVADGPPLAGFNSYAYAVAFSPDGRTLAVGSADTTIRFWDVTHPGHPTQIGSPLRGPTSYIYWLAYSPDGHQLAAAITDGTLWIWQIDQDKPTVYATLTRSSDALYTTAYAPNGRVLEAAGADGITRLWDPDPQRAASWICATAGSTITQQEWERYVPEGRYRPPCR